MGGHKALREKVAHNHHLVRIVRLDEEDLVVDTELRAEEGKSNSQTRRSGKSKNWLVYAAHYKKKKNTLT